MSKKDNKQNKTTNRNSENNNNQKNYYEELTQLSKIYGREDKKSSARGVSGGYKK